MDDFNDDERAMPPSYPPSHHPDQEAAPAQMTEEDSSRSGSSFILELATIIAVALLISVIVKAFFAQAFAIPSESMEDTLIPGDRIMVNKLADSADDLNRGDVVVFVDPGNWLAEVPEDDSPGWRKAISEFGQIIGLLPKNIGDHLVKRIIGMPGDHVVCCNEVGQITVNDVALDETYLKPGVAPSATPFDVVVPEDHVWVLGDNRPRSKDARFHQQETGFGFVPIRNIEGRAWLTIYPLNRFGTLPSAADVFAAVPEP